MIVHPDFIATNLADIARDNNGARILEADEIAVGLLQEYYYTDNKAFAAENLKPLAYRDGAMFQAQQNLERLETRTTEQDEQLTVLNEAIELEAEFLSNTPQLVIVVPDQHHWKFTRPEGEENLSEPYKFDPGTTPLIEAWPELRYAGLLSNPADPSKGDFDTKFVLDAQRLADRATNISNLTEHSAKHLITSVFVNAAQVMGRRIEYGTPEGQYTPSHWVAQAETAKKALELVP